MQAFKAKLELIGINPYVFLPIDILKNIFAEAVKYKGHIPIKGTVNFKSYKQTLVKYKGAWRLYINTTILKNSPKRIGEIIEITIEFDSSDRTVKPHPKFMTSLNKNKEAKKVFKTLSPSKQNEIVKYISKLKTEASREKNIDRAINFLLGKERFIGRDKP